MDTFISCRQASSMGRDDVVLLASSRPGPSACTGAVCSQKCEAAGMRISTSKSEAMVLDLKRVVCPLRVSGEVLPQVEEFKYLGVLFTSEGKMEREIDRRIGAADRTVVVKKELSRKAKLSIYREAAICSAPSSVNFAENNTVGDLVVTITVQPGVTVGFVPPPANPDNPFRLDENRLIAARVLDFETATTHAAQIICTDTNTGLQLNLVIVVLVTNLNDNPPVFDQSIYNINVNEMSPVGTVVGRFAATDLDNNVIYYTLTPESSGFELMSQVNPNLLVETPFDYDKVKNVRLVLHAQIGVLPLKPGPIYAIDGDLGINEEITYSFLNGNGDGLFEISPNTGNITMLKPADMLGPISLTVLAAQKVNAYQFATTTVTIDVQVESLHRPQFQRSQYDGVVSTVGTMAVDPKNKDEPLVILATDDDYASTGGRNPHITYRVIGSSDFSIIDGYLFMIKVLPEGKLALQVEAIDTSNDESATAQLTVEVTSTPTSGGTTCTAALRHLYLSLTTTSFPQSTTDNMGTTSIGESTVSQTTEEIMSTSNPSMTTEITSSSMPTEDSVSTASTAQPVQLGGYRAEDMAAVGATLGVLLLICLVVIVVLAVCIKKDRADWKKIYKANRFRNSLAQGSTDQKGDIQHTNGAFQDDEGGNSTGSGKVAGAEPRESNISFYEEVKPSMAPPLRDDTSQAGSDKVDSEEVVKPILTKERRMDEGYKSVWFKEDIDPNAKEEVVIIPDSREDDSEEEDEEQTSSDREEDGDDTPAIKNPRVLFSDTDLDSGLGLKMGDPLEDSDDEEIMTNDL
ncbi:hypothetical protein L3Q82_007152 [Scortum barcoo]|uniref:Uncharacterized protein n=1 Tax=Scortum barcoo TaxID=214431 RepID=A0ACB8WSL6_9TELE|nr:hypothetical protein L3Q82_007152 [Scortum barcoo]